ncbi:hypothetical protein [Pseudomonas farris]
MTRIQDGGKFLYLAINRTRSSVTDRRRVIRTVGGNAPNVGAAEGCDLFISRATYPIASPNALKDQGQKIAGFASSYIGRAHPQIK